MTVETCLPPGLSGPKTQIVPIAPGLSGASVYRVEADGRSFVLKVAGEAENDADWRSALEIQRLAADSGLTPRIVHVDEARHAVLTAFVVDRSFTTFYLDPRTHEAAIGQLGRTVRRIQSLPVPQQARIRDPHEVLGRLWRGLQSGFSIPNFARDAVLRVLAEDPPSSGSPLLLGHNDLNPTNLIYDGDTIQVLDWATAGPMDVFYDLAVVSVFLRMDEANCLRLLSAYEGEPAVELPLRFRYLRRLAAALAGAMQLSLARLMNYAGATGGETLASAASLGEFYQGLRSGHLKVGTAEGQWVFGLALLKESLSF